MKFSHAYTLYFSTDDDNMVCPVSHEKCVPSRCPLWVHLKLVRDDDGNDASMGVCGLLRKEWVEEGNKSLSQASTHNHADMGFKVGDDVYDIERGYGVVSKVDRLVHVHFANEKYNYPLDTIYQKSGYDSDSDTFQRLFYAETVRG